MKLDKLKQWVLERVPVNTEELKHLSSEPVPNHLKRWWWCLGGTPAYLFIVQVITGILLTFYYVPSFDDAYESVRYITEEVPFGWWLRSVHKWSSIFMIMAVVLHTLRVFFTGAYRKPRELTWMTGVSILGITLFFGFTGYSLVFEQLSYWGATVAGNMMEAVPWVGEYLARMLRGGETVGDNTLTRFYILHIGVLPTGITILLFLHIVFIRVHGVSQFEFRDEQGTGKTYPFYPDHFFTELIIGVALTVLLTCFAVIFPAELGEKANPLVTPAHIKPEWYFYFTFRWLKITGLTFAVLSTGFFFFMMFIWPFVDAGIRKLKPKSELSVWIGAVAFVGILILTLWEALAEH